MDHCPSESVEVFYRRRSAREYGSWRSLWLSLAILLFQASGTPAALAICVGDCTNDGSVTVDEIILGVNIALGNALPAQCPKFDVDGDGSVTIDELIVAVNNALNGCPGAPNGVLLSGSASTPAIDALIDLPPSAVDPEDVENGLILTRLDVHLAADATVSQVNAALENVHGGIVSMTRRIPAVTIAIPRPIDRAALDAVVQSLRAAPGILWTEAAHVVNANVLPPAPAGANVQQLAHLLPARFPAAWNASKLATHDCGAHKVRMLIPDLFQSPPLSGEYANFFDEIPASSFSLSGDTGAHPVAPTHGYDVTTTLAAAFNMTNPTGANPFSECLDLDAIQIDGLTTFQVYQRLSLSFPSGKFLVNCSWGYQDELSDTLMQACRMHGCAADEVGKDIGGLPLTRAYDAADWALLTARRRDDFLLSIAAGNDADKPSTAIYLGLGIAGYNEGISVATLLPDDTFLSDSFLWNPSAGNAGFPSLTASNTDISAFRRFAMAFGVDTAPADNVMIVGSATSGRVFDTLVESNFSDDASNTSGLDGPDLFAVGEGVFKLGGFTTGTSFAAPQIAALASYLWLLSFDLRNLPVSQTRQSILANVRGIGVIDAYASALSVDAAALPNPGNAPVRLAILDVNDDGKFDEVDLDMLLGKLAANDQEQHYDRFDLNGDGFTGGSTIERFDLDRIGSTQFGTTLYSSVMQSIESQAISFDETRLTDLEILCYYAYSALYTGDADERKRLAAGSCGISVTVDPVAVTLASGATQQFSATVRGAVDPRVTWSVVSGGGSIDATGLFTADRNAGTATVRASSVADSSVFGDATVTITGGGRYSGTLTFMLRSDGPDVLPAQVSLTAMLTADVIGNTSLVLRSAGGSVFTSTLESTCGPTTFTGSIVGFFQAAPDQLPIFPNTERPTSFALDASGTMASFAGAPDTGCVQMEEAATRMFSSLFIVTNIVRDAGEVVEIDFDRTVSAGEMTSVVSGRLTR